MSLSELGCK